MNIYFDKNSGNNHAMFSPLNYESRPECLFEIQEREGDGQADFKQTERGFKN